MNLIAKRWLVGVGALLLSGSLATGAAFAASGTEAQSTTAPTTQTHRHGTGPGATNGPDLGQLVKDGKITQGEADVLTQLHALRKKQREQLHADAKALIDKAVAQGKITQAQADKLWQNRGISARREGRGGFEKLSAADLKARLDEKVKAGKLTQARADQILKHWHEHQTKKGQ